MLIKVEKGHYITPDGSIHFEKDVDSSLWHAWSDSTGQSLCDSERTLKSLREHFPF